MTPRRAGAKACLNEHPPYLPDLIHFGVGTVSLQVRHMCGTGISEPVMATANSLDETKSLQQSAQVVKSNVGVGAAGENAGEQA